MYRLLLAVLIAFFSFPALGQIIKTSGEFSADTIKIGQELNYSLSLKYPRNVDVVFPDSTFSFAPFEFLSKQSFQTKSDSIYSFDSAVYTLATFEIDSVQYLNLPVFMVTDGDSVAIQNQLDSIILSHVVTFIPDSISMLENTEYSNVNLGFNYPYLVAGLTTFTLVSLIFFLVFGKAIKKKIRLYRLKRLHRRFLEKFNITIRDLSTESDNKFFEKIIIDWKGYMEGLNKMPYTKLTSREIQNIYPDEDLTKSLQSIDGAIYGGLKLQDVTASFDYLRKISEDSYHNKLEEIKNA